MRSQREDPDTCSWVPVCCDIYLNVVRLISQSNTTYESVLGDQIRKHVPLSTITHQVRVAEKMRHESAVQRFTSGGNHAFQEKVGSFQFVPEEHVRLTQLEGLRQIVLSHHLHSDHVETSKDPTSSRTLLCRRLTLNTDLIRVVRVIVRCHHRTIERGLGETVLYRCTLFNNFRDNCLSVIL